MGKKSGWLAQAGMLVQRRTSGTRSETPTNPARLRYDWEQPGVSIAVLMHRREELLELNLNDDEDLRSEWMALILEMDRRVRQNTRHSDAPQDLRSGEGNRPRSNTDPASPIRIRSPDVEATRAFLSDFLDNSPSNNERIVGKHSDEPEKQLTEGMMPGTKPKIAFFGNAQFSPPREAEKRRSSSLSQAVSTPALSRVTVAAPSIPPPLELTSQKNQSHKRHPSASSGYGRSSSRTSKTISSQKNPSKGKAAVGKKCATKSAQTGVNRSHRHSSPQRNAVPSRTTQRISSSPQRHTSPSRRASSPQRTRSSSPRRPGAYSPIRPRNLSPQKSRPSSPKRDVLGPSSRAKHDSTRSSEASVGSWKVPDVKIMGRRQSSLPERVKKLEIS